MHIFPTYECGWYDSIQGVWMVGEGGLDEDGHPHHVRLATPEEAQELEGASDYQHREYLATIGL